MAALPRRRLMDTIALAVVVFALSLLAVRFRAPGAAAAMWWPAVGVGVAWVLRRGRPDLLLLGAVAAGSGAANIAGGRSVSISLVFAVANCADVLVVAWYLTGGRVGRFRLDDVADVGRFVLAVVLGSLTAGLVVAVWGRALEDGAPLQAAPAVVVAHGAAVLLIAPVVLTPAWSGGRTARARVELCLQWAGLLGVAGTVFHPGQVQPIAFLCLPVVVWTAVRSGARATAWQLLALGVLVTAATVVGWGPFAASARSQQTLVAIAQAFIMVHSATVLLLAVEVAERGRLARRVAEREALYRHGFEDALLGMLLVGRRAGVLRVLEVNPVGARLLGSTPEALVGSALPEAVHVDDRAALSTGALAVLTGTVAGWRGELRVAAGDRTRWMDVAVAPSRNRHCDPVLSVQLVDATERHDAHAHLRQLALHDPLTGLPNRSLLVDRLDHALAAAERVGSTVGLAYVDLDGFKAVNDEAGHDAGDVVLVTTARRLQSLVRPGDTVARVGGDEFVVLFPSAGEAEVRVVLERMVTSLAEPLTLDDAVYRIRASYGVAVGGGTTSARALLRAADAQMYAAKRRRRPLPATTS
jgi:hypothetical protein